MKTTRDYTVYQKKNIFVVIVWFEKQFVFIIIFKRMNTKHDVEEALIERKAKSSMRCLFFPAKLFVVLIDAALLLWGIDAGFYSYRTTSFF